VDITYPSGARWNEGTLATLANGYALMMAPLDILSFYNTIANRGTMVEPYLVEMIQGGETPSFRHTTRVLKECAMTTAVADTLAKALRYVTTDGTARWQLSDAKVPIAGKTGTSHQVLSSYKERGLPEDPYQDNAGRHKTVSTYAGFFPADAPQYSIICVLYSYPTNKSFFGGTYPARIVREVANRMDYK